MLNKRSLFFLLAQVVVLFFCKTSHGQELTEDESAKWEDSVLNIFDKKVPELSGVMSRFTEYYQVDTSYINNGDTLSATEWVEGPYNVDSPVKNYEYCIYVGESHADHYSRWYTFVMTKDFKKIRYYDGAYDKIYPLNHWKKLWPATKFLHPHKKLQRTQIAK